jgi:hypothetical protein
MKVAPAQPVFLPAIFHRRLFHKLCKSILMKQAPAISSHVLNYKGYKIKYKTVLSNSHDSL